MKKILIFLSIIIGCDPEPIPVYFIDAREEPGDFTPIRKACEFWNLDCYTSKTDGRGSLTIVLSDFISEVEVNNDEEDRCVGGKLLDDSFCEPAIWVAMEMPLGIEHEIGHAFSLTHENIKDNIMERSNPGSDIEDDQERKHQRTASAFTELCF